MAGLPQGCGFDDPRRANATGLVAGGVDVRTAQARLGHSDVYLTLEIYAQATSEADRKATETIGRNSIRTAQIARSRGIAAGSSPSPRLPSRSRDRLTWASVGRGGGI